MNAHSFEHYADRIAPRTASRVLLWVILSFLFALLVLAFVLKVSSTTRAQGRVIPSSQLQTISNLEPGIVANILVHPGDRVRRGQTLVLMDPTEATADLGKGAVTADALQARIVRLQAEIAGTTPNWPADLERRAPDLVLAERKLHDSRMAELSSQIAAANARASAARQDAVASELTAQTRAAAGRSAAERAAMIRPLVDKGIEPRMSLVQAENDESNAQGDAASARESAGRANASAAEARAEVAQARADWLAKTGQDLAQARADFASQQSVLPAAEQRVRRTTVVSPVNGTVNRVLVTTRGSSVQAGSPLVEVVPSDDRLIVEAQVKPADIGFIYSHQKATVKITAYDSSLYGSLHGEVVSISPDATVDQKTNQSYYTIQVATDQKALRAPSGEMLPVGAGMVAEVDLLGRKRRIISYLLTPISRVTETAFREGH